MNKREEAETQTRKQSLEELLENFKLPPKPDEKLAASASKAIRKVKLEGGEQQFRERGFGKWSQTGVPHKGWTCVDVEDLEDERMICEMCESAEVRYVHLMTHPEWEGELSVGCICAGNMEEDLVGARLREAEFRRCQQPEVAAALSWILAADEILERWRELDRGEYEFVRDMRSRAQHDAMPRVRKRYRFSEKQMRWFRAIYLRVVGKPVSRRVRDDGEKDEQRTS